MVLIYKGSGLYGGGEGGGSDQTGRESHISESVERWNAGLFQTCKLYSGLQSYCAEPCVTIDGIIRRGVILKAFHQRRHLEGCQSDSRQYRFS